MRHAVAESLLHVAAESASVRCRKRDESCTEVHVRAGNIAVLDLCLEMTHVQIEVPEILISVRKRLLCALAGSLHRVACSIQMGKRMMLHLYGRHHDVSGARMAVHKAINVFLGKMCVETTGCFPSAELANSGCFTLYGTRIDSRAVLFIDGRRVSQEEDAATYYCAENVYGHGDNFLTRFLQTAGRVPLHRKTLNINALRLKYVLYYRRQVVEDMLSLHDCFLETGAKADVISFDVHKLRSCVRELQRLCCDVVEVETYEGTIAGEEVLVVQTGTCRVMYCWTDDAVGWLCGRESKVRTKLYLCQEVQDAFRRRTDEKLQFIAARTGCSVALGDALRMQGTGRSMAHALELLGQKRPCQSCFLVHDKSHRMLIGRRGRNIRKIMRRYRVHVRALPESERLALCLSGNVMAVSTCQNAHSLERVRVMLGGRTETLRPRLVNLLDFVFKGVERYLYLQDKVIVFEDAAEKNHNDNEHTRHKEIGANAKTDVHGCCEASFLFWMGSGNVLPFPASHMQKSCNAGGPAR
eukprot:jgi/Antlo1/119/367